MIPNVQAIIPFIVAQFFSHFALGAEGKVAYHSPAKALAKEVGKITEKENGVVELSQPTPPAGWKTFRNNLFSISYPECFSAQDMPKAEGVLLERNSNCEYFSKVPNSTNWIAADARFLVYKKPDAATRSNTLLRQHYKINGLEAFRLVAAEDYTRIGQTKDEPRIRTEIYLVCGDYNFVMGYYAPPGQPSIDMARSKKFDIPEDFKQIISSFRCAKEEKNPPK